MVKEIMDRREADNVYLHRDFHISFKIALDYCHELYGDKGVEEYLRTFSAQYFEPLKDDIKSKGLEPLQKYFKEIYAIEEAEVEIKLKDNVLTVRVPSSILQLMPTSVYVSEGVAQEFECWEEVGY